MYIYFGREIVKWGGIYEFTKMWLKCGTCGFIGRWRFRPGYDMRCGLLGDGDSALIVISRGLWLIHLCYAWDAKVVWRVPLPRSISAMPWDAKDSMTWPPSPPMMFMGYIMDEGDSVLVCWFMDEGDSVLVYWFMDEGDSVLVYCDLRVRSFPSGVCDMWTRYISLS